MGVQYSNGTVELLTELVESDTISGVLHVGDISYAGNVLPTYHFQFEITKKYYYFHLEN